MEWKKGEPIVDEEEDWLPYVETGFEPEYDPEDEPMLHTTQGEVRKLDCDLFSWIQSMLYTLTVAILFSTFVGSLTKVSGSSMEPTLHDGELLFLMTFAYSPEVGDVVVVNKPTVEYLEGVSIVKRVIATEGQRVQIDYNENTVYVDGVPLEEPYLSEKMRPIYGHMVSEEVVVPENSIYVLGDNRNNSSDSRYDQIGTIDVGYVLGEAKFGVFPISSWRVIS